MYFFEQWNLRESHPAEEYPCRLLSSLFAGGLLRSWKALVTRNVSSPRAQSVPLTWQSWPLSSRHTLSGRGGAISGQGPSSSPGSVPRPAVPSARSDGILGDMGLLVWTLAAGVLLAPTLARALSPGRAGAPRSSRRPARGCADRPEELLEQLYGRLAAGVLGAFQHTLQPGPREQARNTSCPGGRPDWRFRPPTPLRSVSPWAYRLSYDPTRYPRLLPEAYCLCRGCLTGPRGEEDLSLRSAPVLLPTVVLRRTPGCAGGRSVYTEEYVAVPVGCTCVPAPIPDRDAPADPGGYRHGKERTRHPGHQERDRNLRRPVPPGAGQ